MPLWILGPLLGWALASGTSSLVLIVKDHYDLKSAVTEIAKINEEGSRKLREHLRSEERQSQQMIYLQGDLTEVKGDVKGIRDDITELKILLQTAIRRDDNTN